VTDYGRALQFGIFPSPEAASLDEIFALTSIAEKSGLDLIGIQDHPYQRRFLDTWMLMATILARTQRVRVFPDVANLPLRPPAMIAKAAASLDVMSGGRFELGLGAGAFWDAVEAMGGQRRSPGEAVTATEEAITVIRLMWSSERSVRYAGHHYRLSGVKPGPQPAHPISIWLGAGGPRMLGLLGRAADGWVPSSSWATPDKLPKMNRLIDDAAEAVGRDPSDIRRLYNVYGAVGTSREFLKGPVEQWVDELTPLVVEQGVDTFIFGPAEDPVRQVGQFAEEVVPAVRESVQQHRTAAKSDRRAGP